MSDDGDDPLADRSDDREADANDPDLESDAVDEWVESVASDSEQDHPDEDPFERIGEGSGPRHGDPFDAFDGAEDSDEAATEDTTETQSADSAPEGLPSGMEDDAEDPFTEFDEPATDPFGEGESVFERPEVGEVDDDGVWERMESTEGDAEAVPGKRYVDVDKHSYCEGCEYFSEPPDVGCSHEGTEILEFVDMETVRVVDCPIVAERTALEDID